MKQFLVFILTICLVSISCNEADLVDSNCTYSTEISEKYKSNAMHMLVLNMQNNPTHPDYSNLEFNQDSIDHILSAVQAVKDLNTTTTDSIFSGNFITHPIMFSSNTIKFSIDSLFEEAQLLRNTGVSGNEELDLLIENSGLVLISLLSSFGNIQFTFSTQNDCNLSSVNDQLEEISFVLYPSFISLWAMEGSTIPEFQFSKISNNVSSLVFKRFYYDDMSYLLYDHWIYEVDENCNAELVYSLN